jgi:hypothetical protein
MNYYILKQVKGIGIFDASGEDKRQIIEEDPGVRVEVFCL